MIRSGRRTLALEITHEGELIVRAPMRASDSEIATFAKEHEDWVNRRLPSVLARRRPPLSPEEERVLRDRARADLPARTERWARLMGIEYSGISITSARHRFGSCNANGRICYSFRLMEFPESVIDYVVVHELAHLVEMNHSPRFYAVVERVLPDYKTRKKLLKILENIMIVKVMKRYI